MINLFEADYNLSLKLLYGYNMVRRAEKVDKLNDQRHGSWPRRTAIDALFLNRPSKDLINELKIISACMNKDANGCYDRIIISIERHPGSRGCS